MIEPPPRIRPDDAVLYADWVELCALADPDGVVSQVDVRRALGEEDSFREDRPRDEDDPKGPLVDRIWSCLSDRARLLRDAYPLDPAADLIRRTADSWQRVPSFTAILLMANIARFDPDVEVPGRDGLTFQRLFEKVVQACTQGLFKGTSVRFGTPIEPSWPTPIGERIEKLATLLDLEVGNIDPQIGAADNDRTLDVITRLDIGGIGGHAAGSLVVLTQCATGRHWKEKSGEPKLAMWDNILVWDSGLVRALAWIFQRFCVAVAA